MVSLLGGSNFKLCFLFISSTYKGCSSLTRDGLREGTREVGCEFVKRKDKCREDDTDGEGREILKLTSDPLREEHADVTGEERVEVDGVDVIDVDGVEMGEQFSEIEE